MTARSEVVALLETGLPPGVDVIAYSHNIDGPSKPTVMVRQDRVAPAGQGQGLRQYDMTLTLIAPLITYGPADDQLDQLLDDVLYALTNNDTPAGVVFVEANRGTYGEPDPTNPGYDVAIQVTTALEPVDTVGD